MLLLKNLKTYASFLMLMLLLTSLVNCTITKRQFRKGYHVNWHNKKSVTNQKTDLKAEISPSEAHTSKTEPNSEASLFVEQLTPEATITLAETQDKLIGDDIPTMDVEIQSQKREQIGSEHVQKENREEEEENKNARKVPLWLSIPIFIFTLQLVIGGTVGLFLLPALFLGVGGLFLGGVLALFFLVACINLYFLLFSRKVTKYSSKSERNKMYLLYAFLIALPIVAGIAALFYIGYS